MTERMEAVDTAPKRARLFSFADRKIGAKIALGFGAMLAITLTLSGLAFFSIDKIGTNFENFAHKALVATLTNDIERDFLWLRRLMREFGLTGDERLLEQGRKQRQIVADGIDAALAEIRSPKRLAMIRDAKEKFATYVDFADKITKARMEQDRSTKEVLDPVGMQMRKDIDKMQAWASGKDGNAAAASLSGEAMKKLLLVRLNVNKTLVRHDQATAERAGKYFDDLRAGLAAFAAQATNDDARRLANEVGAQAQRYFGAYQTASSASRELEDLLNGAALKAGAALAADLEDVKRSAAGEEKELAGETASLISFSQRLSLGLAGAGLLLGLALAWSMARAIAGPVKKMTQAMTSLAAGRLDVEIPARGRSDEIGEMAEAVQVFKEAAVAKLRRDAEIEEERVRHQGEQRQAEEEAIRHERETVATSIGAGLSKLSAKDLTYRMTDDVPEAYRRLQIDFNAAIAQLESALAVVASGAQAIGSGVNQIATAADDLSKRTEQQAASLEETAAALEEITVTVKSSAEGAAHASDIVGVTKTEAEKSGEIVRHAVDAMGRIEKSSQEIGQIIGVIDEIAFQTNLLALNAGVEAARAGDAGKGFAVVASEVRALAQRSAEAAKEIKNLISASSMQVEEGVELVGETGKALEKIVAQVAEIDKVVDNIANGAREQATSLAEVNTAVGQMDQNTQKNAAMVEQTTAASHNLRRETEQLLRSVGGFRIDAPVAKTSAATRPKQRPPLESIAGARSGSAVRKVEVEQDGWEEF